MTLQSGRTFVLRNKSQRSDLSVSAAAQKKDNGRLILNSIK